MLPRLVVVFTWCCLVPFFASWTVLGTIWLRNAQVNSQRCLADGTQPSLILFWQLLSYVWVCIYLVYFFIACVVEYRLRRAERNMRLIQNDESLSRWGPMAPAVSDTMAALKTQ